MSEQEKRRSQACQKPHLGLATTAQLLAELSARIEVHGPGLDYRTVDPCPTDDGVSQR